MFALLGRPFDHPFDNPEAQPIPKTEPPAVLPMAETKPSKTVGDHEGMRITCAPYPRVLCTRPY